MPARWIRRPITVTTFLLCTIFMWLFGPIIVVFAALKDAAQRRTDWATARTVMYFIAFFTCEFLGLLGAFIVWLIYIAMLGQPKDWYLRSNYLLQRFWGRGLFWSCVQIFNMEMEVRSIEALSLPGTKLILVRHASTLDTMLPIAFCPDGTGFRYVMKEELLWDPCLDFVGARLPDCFVKRGKGRTDSEVARVVALADDMGPNDVVVIFPEGTRFTREKQAQLMAKAAETDDPFFEEATETLFNTLPPMRRGPVELLLNQEFDHIVFMAHAGCEEAGTIGQLIHGGLVDRRFIVDTWAIPGDEFEKTEEGVKRFLLENWKRVDVVASAG